MAQICQIFFVIFGINSLIMGRFIRAAALGLVLAITGFGWAQDEAEAPERYVRIVLNDGTIKEGRFLEMTEDVVVLDMPMLGVTRYPKHLVQYMQDLESYDGPSSERRAYSENPQASRYFFAPSGIQLKANQGYFQSNIGLNSVNYGLSDGLTVGAVLSFLGGGGAFKVGTQVGEKTHISAGGIGFTDYYGILDAPLGLAFINVTRGTERKNITLNLGLANRDDDLLFYRGYEQGLDGYYRPAERANGTSRPFIVNVSGMTPIGEARWLLTENYLIVNRVEVGAYGNVPEGDEMWSYSVPSVMQEGVHWEAGAANIMSLGIRTLNRRTGWLWDYGLVGVFAGGDGFAAPWFSFTLAF